MQTLLRQRASLVNRMLPATIVSSGSSRPFISVFDKITDRFSAPMKHMKSFMDPDGHNYESQMPEGYRTHGNSAASFSASLTQNSIELN